MHRETIMTEQLKVVEYRTDTTESARALGIETPRCKYAVAVPSRAAAVRAFNAADLHVTDAFLRDHAYPDVGGPVADNARAEPGTVFVMPDQSRCADLMTPVPTATPAPAADQLNWQDAW